MKSLWGKRPAKPTIRVARRLDVIGFGAWMSAIRRLGVREYVTLISRSAGGASCPLSSGARLLSFDRRSTVAAQDRRKLSTPDKRGGITSVIMASDLVVMAKLSADLEDEHRTRTPNRWVDSPFQWLRHEAPSRKGAIGKEMFKRWAQSAGFEVAAAPPRSQCDCVVAGLKVAVKFGLQWANGTFVFEQIRKQDYAVGALLGLEPQRAHLWVVPRDILWRGSQEQHGSETHWLRFHPSEPPGARAVRWNSGGGPSVAARTGWRRAREVTRNGSRCNRIPLDHPRTLW